MNGKEQLRAEWLSEIEKGLQGKNFWESLTPARLQEFIDADAEINAEDGWGFSPIHRIAENNENSAVIKKLIAAEADIHSKAKGSPPIHWAAQNNPSPAVIKEFITKDPSLIHDKSTGRRGNGNTPLHWAAESNKNVAVIKELIDAGANIHEKNANGETAHDLLSRNSALKDNTEAQELLRGKITNKTSNDDNDEYATSIRNDEYEMPPRNGLEDDKEYAKKVIEDWLTKSTSKKVVLLLGYAGTGKTHFIGSLNFGNIKPDFCALTGKAASVMREHGLKNARTIHSLFYEIDNENSTEDEPCFKPRQFPSRSDLVVVDECSVVSKEMVQELLSNVTEKLILLGDEGQLPPVKGESFFKSDEPYTIPLKFKEIHRQEKNSPILAFATRARQGQEIEASSNPDCMVEYTSTSSTNKSLYDKGEIIICGRNDTKHRLNKEALRRKGLTKNWLMEGMRVACSKNNHSLGLLNGTIWTVEQIKEIKKHNDGKEQREYFTAECTLIDDDGKKRKAHLINSSFRTDRERWDFSHFTNKKDRAVFDYGYAITCHKAQGSQWERVSIYVENMPDYDKWLYTAATRARKSLYVLFTKT